MLNRDSHTVILCMTALAGWACLPCCLVRAGDDPRPPPVSSSAASLVSSSSVQAAEENDRSPGDFWFHRRLTGDWGGARTELEEAGLSFALHYNSYFGVNAHGGMDTNNAHRFSGSYDLIITVDFDRMGVIPGGKLLAFAQGFYGDSRNVNTKVGAIGQPFDDADGTRAIYVDQLWYQQTFWDGKARLRLGRLDQQSILDRNLYANSEDKQFMNTYLDNNNAIIPLAIGNGASLFLDPTDWLGFVIGVADGEARQFDTGLDTTFHDGGDLFGFFQTDFRINLPSKNGKLPGNYRLGLLYDPGTKPVIMDETDGGDLPNNETGDVAFYLSFDQLVYREGTGDLQGLGLFLRYGRRDDTRINRISNFWSFGMQYAGLLPTRDEDVLGLGMYSVHSSHRYRREIDSAFVWETGYELYYRIQVAPWLQITPDLQYITNPGALSSSDDAFIMGLRARLTF